MSRFNATLSDVLPTWPLTVSLLKNLIYQAWAETLYFDIADENKTKIAKSGALVPLTRLAKSKDMRVQRNATGALLNMTHSGRYSLDICMV
jgi:hypothetical protein